jgi:teichuronic acid biosynthesis glycosyltransferase TuaC
LRVVVVAEYYPRPAHPAWGIWAHRQALAVAEEGVEVRVLALERPLPPLSALRALGPGAGGPDTAPFREWIAGVRAQPAAATLDGIPVRYVRFLSPPRPLSYGTWGRWAAPALGRALDELSRSWAVDLVHAHYAVPAGDAALRWIESRGAGLPLVVSVHGGDLSFAVRRAPGRAAVERTLRRARAVLANSTQTGEAVEQLIGPHEGLRVVHPGADASAPASEPYADPTLVTLAHLEPHKSQADVIRALAALRGHHPGLRYVLVGKGPDRQALEALARSLGVGDRVVFRGALAHEEALAELARCHVHAMPSRRDAFGVAHLEAMAAGVPTIAGAGTGAEDIARVGEGILLVRPGDVSALVRALDRLLSEPRERRRLGEAGQHTVAERFSWRRCGLETAAAYREATGAA